MPYGKGTYGSKMGRPPKNKGVVSDSEKKRIAAVRRRKRMEEVAKKMRKPASSGRPRKKGLIKNRG